MHCTDALPDFMISSESDIVSGRSGTNKITLYIQLRIFLISLCDMP